MLNEVKYLDLQKGGAYPGGGGGAGAGDPGAGAGAGDPGAGDLLGQKRKISEKIDKIPSMTSIIESSCTIIEPTYSIIKQEDVLKCTSPLTSGAISAVHDFLGDRGEGDLHTRLDFFIKDNAYNYIYSKLSKLMVIDQVKKKNVLEQIT